MIIKHKSHQFELLFEHLKLHFLKQVGSLALNVQLKIFLCMISGMFEQWSLITSVCLLQVGNNKNDHFTYFLGVRVRLNS